MQGAESQVVGMTSADTMQQVSVCVCVCVCDFVCVSVCLCVCACTHAGVQSCLTVHDPVDCSSPGSSVRETF